ncbi:MAG: hypothetical protein K5640_07040 [Treponema sp.]|nr:hypothetical protein [Treponema sp.]
MSDSKKNVSGKTESNEEKSKEKAPIVAAGDYYKKIKVRFKGLVCASFGTSNAGDYSEIPVAYAKELAEAGLCEIVKE